VKTVPERLDQLQKALHSRACECGRNPDEIQLLAVSKTFPPSIIEEVAKAGQTLFGENRIQEATLKIPQVVSRGLRWHLIGHLQSNKVRRAVELFDVIQTVDRQKIANKIAAVALSAGKSVDVFVQVNVAGEKQKSGILPQDVFEMVELVDSLPCLELQGLMAIPPFAEDPEAVRPHFRQLRLLLDEINGLRLKPLKGLSMGMSGDFGVAIEEGATLVRIGTAVFGSRG